VNPKQYRLSEFERHRPRLFGIAYRMLSSHADAEDVLQDAYLLALASWGIGRAAIARGVARDRSDAAVHRSAARPAR
jgi:DNA-directed RNA polymerase specialized sigma24 family protein